ncbi:MAG: hypothetical protein QXK12_00075 [Candidatus Nezhaarchaeales archaeon]
MVCWVIIAKYLGFKISQPDEVEKELMLELNARNHEELKVKVERMDAEELRAILTRILERLKKKGLKMALTYA